MTSPFNKEVHALNANNRIDAQIGMTRKEEQLLKVKKRPCCSSLEKDHA